MFAFPLVFCQIGLFLWSYHHVYFIEDSFHPLRWQARHPKIPKYFYGMMLDCWQQDRERRPSFRYLAEVLEMLCRADKLKEAVSANWGDVRP